MPSPIVIDCADTPDFVARAVTWMTQKAVAAIAERGQCVIGLSGGTTPRPVYEHLGKSTEIDWSKVWIFLVDDRYIAADDPKSNQFLLRSSLLQSAPIPESQILFPDTTLPVEKCVDQYGKQVGALIAKHGIDQLTLGLGNDGHTASLFPPLSDDAFSDVPVIHTTTQLFDVVDRISLTLPTLQHARDALLLLKGGAKKKVWEEMLLSTEGPSRWPMKTVINRRGETTVFWTA